VHAHELLGHEEVSQLLANVAKAAPKLVEDLVPRVLPMAVLVRVLQSLLAERVPLRNMRAIVETLAEQAPAPRIRPCCSGSACRAGRQIVQDIAGMAGDLPVMTLDPELERLLQGSIEAPIHRRPDWNRAWRSAAEPPGRKRAAAGTPGGTGGAAGAAATATDAGAVHSSQRPEHACSGLDEIPDNASASGVRGRSMTS